MSNTTPRLRLDIEQLEVTLLALEGMEKHLQGVALRVTTGSPAQKHAVQIIGVLRETQRRLRAYMDEEAQAAHAAMHSENDPNL